MKKLLFIMMLLFTSLVNGQTSDSTKQEINKLRNDVNSIQMHLNKCNSTFNIGVAFCVGGAAIALISKGYEYEEDKNVILGTGVVFSLIGAGVMIYSHQFMQNTTIGITNNGASIKYSF